MVEIIVSGGTVVTMDLGQRVKKEGVVAIEGSRIVDIGLDTIVIDGKVLMKNRVVKTVNEAETLGAVQEEAKAAISQSGLKVLLEYTDRYWGQDRYRDVKLEG